MIDKTFIINLQRRNDKKIHMENQIQELTSLGYNINHNFFNAIDGNNDQILSLIHFNCYNWFDPTTGKAITKGEIGCALSHYHIWLEIVKLVESDQLSSKCNVMILEDDVIFNNNFVNNINNYFRQVSMHTPDYDMIYIHRKPLDVSNEYKISENLNKSLKSYWTCGYILSYLGAKKLINSNYIDNIIPVDEFLPIMYDENITYMNHIYNKSDKFLCISFYPNLLSLTHNAFTDSETFHSVPYKNEVYSYSHKNVIKYFKMIYVGLSTSDSYNRYINYCKIYGIPLIIINSINDVKKEILSWINVDFDNTLIMLIDNSDNKISILPIASPKEIVESYNMYNSDIVLPSLEEIRNYFYFGSCRNFLDNNLNYCIDSKNMIYQILDINSSLDIDTQKSRLINLEYETLPCILIANNERSNIIMNRIENYTGDNWNQYYGYKLFEKHFDDYPLIFIYNISSIQNDKLNYPKNKIISDNLFSLEKQFSKFIDSAAEYFLYISNDSVINNMNLIFDLLKTGKNVIAPLLRKGTELWTNFWGDIANNGFYQRSFDYQDILTCVKIGCWNVPYITSTFMIHRSVGEKVPNLFIDNMHLDIDMRMCYNLRINNIFMYLTNMLHFGYLGEYYINPILDIMDDNKKEIWEKKYLHPHYLENINSLEKISYRELADGIYVFPLFTQIFCKEIIEIAEKYNKWSPGKNNHIDKRLGENYYENFPTVDVQLFQLDLKLFWEKIVSQYISKLASFFYSNYKTKGVNLAFVVRYKLDEQPSLSPHHDSSTYTVNIALNNGNGIDYNGGGCRFIRQNIVLKNQEPGYCCIHPGRLTAYHEGLPITEGTRYILVSFID